MLDGCATRCGANAAGLEPASRSVMASRRSRGADVEVIGQSTARRPANRPMPEMTAITMYIYTANPCGGIAASRRGS